MHTPRRKKGKWPWILGIAIILLVLVVIWLDGTMASSGIIDPRTVATYTRDELVDLFWEYKGELEEIAEIVLANDALKQRIIDSYEGYGEIRFEPVYGNFPEEDWNKIIVLFQKIRCYDIVRLFWGGKDWAVQFLFRDRKADGKEISTQLYYFRDVQTMEFYKKYYMGSWPPHQVLEHIDGCWYVYESIIERGT